MILDKIRKNLRINKKPAEVMDDSHFEKARKDEIKSDIQEAIGSPVKKRYIRELTDIGNNEESKLTDHVRRIATFALIALISVRTLPEITAILGESAVNVLTPLIIVSAITLGVKEGWDIVQEKRRENEPDLHVKKHDSIANTIFKTLKKTKSTIDSHESRMENLEIENYELYKEQKILKDKLSELEAQISAIPDKNNTMPLGYWTEKHSLSASNKIDSVKALKEIENGKQSTL